MFEEGQLYAPITQGADGAVEVQLADDHPGVGDPVYRARRNSIAALALAWTPGDPVPHAQYTAEEHEVWQQVSRELAVLHERLACREYLDPQRRDSSGGGETMTAEMNRAWIPIPGPSRMCTRTCLAKGHLSGKGSMTWIYSNGR